MCPCHDLARHLSPRAHPWTLEEKLATTQPSRASVVVIFVGFASLTCGRRCGSMRSFAAEVNRRELSGPLVYILKYTSLRTQVYLQVA